MSVLNSGEKRTRSLVALALLLLAIALIGLLCGPRLILQDFSIYRYATERWIGGNNPYELPDMASYVRGEIGGLDSRINELRVWSPPYFLFMMTPFAILGLELGKGLYVMVLLGALVGWAWITSRELARGTEGTHRQKNAAYLALAVLAMPLCVPESTLTWGGMSLLASVGFLLLATSRNFASFPRWVLFWLLVSIKPHAVFGAVVAFMILLPPRERWRSLLALVTVGALFASFLFIYSPQVVDQFLDLDGSITDVYQPFTQTLVGRLRIAGVSRYASYLLSAVLWSSILLTVVKMQRRSLSFRDIVAVAILFNVVSIFLSPYAWMHDYQSALGWLWGTCVLGVRAGRLAAFNICLILGLNFSGSVMHLSVLQSQLDDYASELTTGTICSALYAACTVLNMVRISKYYQGQPSACCP
jgi:hypothetical protein